MAQSDDPTLWRVDDVPWAALRPLLVGHKPRQQPGRPRHDDRCDHGRYTPILRVICGLVNTQTARWHAAQATTGAYSA